MLAHVKDPYKAWTHQVRKKVKKKNTFAPYFRNIKVVLKAALDLFHLLTHLIRFLTTAMEAHTFVGGVAMLYMYFK